MKPLSFVFGLLFLNSLNAQTLRPDSSFAEVGRIITTNEVELVGIYDVEIAADGSAYLIGTGERFTDDSLVIYLALGKLDVSGNLDNQFGNNGIVHTEHPAGQLYLGESWTQKDGKLLLAGHTFDMYTYEFLSIVQRYNPNGSLDLTFGNQGTFTEDDEEFNLSGQVFELPSGKIMLTATKWLDDGRDACSLIQLNIDGTKDQSFGNDGVVVIEYPDFEYSVKNYDAAFQADGKIIIAGHLGGAEGESDFMMLRVLENGSLDDSFGDNGFFISDLGNFDAIHHVTLQKDGKILFTGGAINADFESITNLLIAGRLNNDGTLDKTFGENGMINFDDYQSQNPLGYQIKVTPDDNLMLGGSVYNFEDLNNQKADIFLMRMNKDGVVDKSFGNNGIFIDDFDAYFDNLYGMKFDSSGRILVYGESISPGFEGPRGFIARYIPDLSLGKFELNDINSSVLTYPNPIANECTIKYDLLKETKVSIDLVNVNGNLIKTFVNQDVKSSGSNQESISMEGLTPGIYLIRIKTELGSTTVKVIKQ